MAEGIEFELLAERYAVVKLPAGAGLPLAPGKTSFWSLTITSSETSLICPEEYVPTNPDCQIERMWRCLKVAGPLEFELKGILLSLLDPLAAASVGVLAMSTYDTDFIFVKEHALERALEALARAGHRSM